MFKAIFIILLVVVSQNAMAGWDKVSANEEATLYADKSTISKTADTVKIWDVTDLKKKDTGGNYMSSKSQHEFDCKAKKSRVLSFSTFSGSMASGKTIISSNRTHDWLPVKDGGEVEDLMNVACDRK